MHSRCTLGFGVRLGCLKCASTLQKQKKRSAGSGAGPGLQLWGWHYLVVASLNTSFRLRAAPLRAGTAPKRG